MTIKNLLIGLVACLLLQACAQTGGSSALRKGQAEFSGQNYRMAFKDLLPLAQKGNSQAQYAIGYMYYNGLGIGKDFRMAEFWLHKSSVQGSPLASKALAMIDKAKASEPFPAPSSLYALNEAHRNAMA